MKRVPMGRAARAASALLAASVIALTATNALADDPARPWLAQVPNAPAPAPAAPEPSRVPWRSSLMIGVSAALGAAAVWVRSRKRGLAQLTASRELRVISSVRVGPKGHLVLAGIGDRALLLGVTDNSVRRIAWLPAESIATGALDATAADGANTAMVPAGATNANALESGSAPAAPMAYRPSSAGKGAFAEILRKVGRRQVDAPPARAMDTSPAATLAEMRRDSVQWSKGAAGAAASAPTGGTINQPEGGAGELEQQAAGILKRRARRRV